MFCSHSVCAAHLHTYLCPPDWEGINQESDCPVTMDASSFTVILKTLIYTEPFVVGAIGGTIEVTLQIPLQVMKWSQLITVYGSRFCDRLIRCSENLTRQSKDNLSPALVRILGAAFSNPLNTFGSMYFSFFLTFCNASFISFLFPPPSALFYSSVSLPCLILSQVSSYFWKYSVWSMVLRKSVCELWGTVTCWGFLQEECGRHCSVMRPTLFCGANAKASPRSPLTLKWWVVFAEICYHWHTELLLKL